VGGWFLHSVPPLQPVWLPTPKKSLSRQIRKCENKQLRERMKIKRGVDLNNSNIPLQNRQPGKWSDGWPERSGFDSAAEGHAHTDGRESDQWKTESFLLYLLVVYSLYFLWRVYFQRSNIQTRWEPSCIRSAEKAKWFDCLMERTLKFKKKNAVIVALMKDEMHQLLSARQNAS